MNEREEKIAEARQLFLMVAKWKKYRFEVLKMVFTERELLTVQPALLMRHIYVRLNVGEDSFNPKCFEAWLRKLRNRQGKVTTPLLTSTDTKSDKIDDFTFTNPMTIPKIETPLIKKAK